MSANAFWKDGKFRAHEVLWDIEVPFALDCGGFTAMKRYGGYRWTIWDYVELATELRPLWWSVMDYCCEPEIANNPDEVTPRVRNTVYSLAKTIATVVARNRGTYRLKSRKDSIISGHRPLNEIVVSLAC